MTGQSSIGDFPPDPHLTAIAIAYKNPDQVLIADQVLPRDNTLSEVLFKYYASKDKHQAFRLPETAVAQHGRVNRLEVQMEELAAAVQDEALEIPLGAHDLKRKNARDMATELATSIIMLRHEVKVAQLVFDPAQFPAGFKEELTGAARFDNVAYEGNTVRILRAAQRKTLMPANCVAIGREAWDTLSVDPNLVSAVHGNDGTKGVIMPADFAKLFGLQECLVGDGWIDTAKPGETPNLQPVWGPHVLFFHRNRAASTQGGVTFGLTGQYGTRIAGSRPAPELGLRGGEIVKVGESTKPLIVAPECGYFMENVVGTAA